MTTPTLFISDLNEQIPEIPTDSIVSRTIYEDERSKVILFGFAAGQELSEHTASRPAILHFLSGESSVKLGDEEFTAGPGSWAHMAAHLPHSIRAHTEVLMLLLML